MITMASQRILCVLVVCALLAHLCVFASGDEMKDMVLEDCGKFLSCGYEEEGTKTCLEPSQFCDGVNDCPASKHEDPKSPVMYHDENLIVCTFLKDLMKKKDD